MNGLLCNRILLVCKKRIDFKVCRARDLCNLERKAVWSMNVSRSRERLLLSRVCCRSIK